MNLESHNFLIVCGYGSPQNPVGSTYSWTGATDRRTGVTDWWGKKTKIFLFKLYTQPLNDGWTVQKDLMLSYYWCKPEVHLHFLRFPLCCRPTWGWPTQSYLWLANWGRSPSVDPSVCSANSFICGRILFQTHRWVSYSIAVCSSSSSSLWAPSLTIYFPKYSLSLLNAMSKPS